MYLFPIIPLLPLDLGTRQHQRREIPPVSNYIRTGPEKRYLLSTGPEKRYLLSTGPEKRYLLSTGPEKRYLLSTGPEKRYLLSTGPEKRYLLSTGPEKRYLLSTGPELLSTGKLHHAVDDLLKRRLLDGEEKEFQMPPN
ncbi:hypothetical protein M8J75_015768 [Diaphorina citri]|nr:hypothetical protein M8J75_015768 [Diaphorina citri]